MSETNAGQSVQTRFNFFGGGSLADSVADRRHDHIHARINNGENPFYLWRTHFHENEIEVAEVLDVNIQDYTEMEENFDATECKDIEAFCWFFKLHPMDLVSDFNVMPTSVAHALVARATNTGLIPSKREKARFGIIGEIEKSVCAFEQERAMAAASGDGLISRSFEALHLSHPFAYLLDSYSDVLNVMLERGDEMKDRMFRAQDMIATMTDKNSREERKKAYLSDRLQHLWSMLKGDQDHDKVEIINKAIEDRGMAFARKVFLESPEDFGLQSWFLPKFVEERMYSWGEATNLFFDLVGTHMAIDKVERQWKAEQSDASRQLDAYEAWLNKPSTQDAIQIFANICLFSKAFAGDTRIQGMLTPFRAAPPSILAKTVFKPTPPC